LRNTLSVNHRRPSRALFRRLVASAPASISQCLVHRCFITSSSANLRERNYHHRRLGPLFHRGSWRPSVVFSASCSKSRTEKPSHTTVSKPAPSWCRHGPYYGPLQPSIAGAPRMRAMTFLRGPVASPPTSLQRPPRPFHSNAVARSLDSVPRSKRQAQKTSHGPAAQHRATFVDPSQFLALDEPSFFRRLPPSVPGAWSMCAMALFRRAATNLEKTVARRLEPLFHSGGVVARNQHSTPGSENQAKTPRHVPAVQHRAILRRPETSSSHLPGSP
jgi:hypothetical protein